MSAPKLMTTKDMTAHREHVAWLEECGEWRAEHRQSLATLARVQAAILQQEAALESHTAHIQSHEAFLQKYCSADDEPGTPEFEFLEQDRAKFAQRHERAKTAHQRLKSHHTAILSEVEKLLKMCELPM